MTERQAHILATIIEQYAEVASPVGSVTLAKLFGVSSATIRAEMARLEEMGLIAQPHTSAGRVPTDQGYRFYVNQISGAATEPLAVGANVKQNEKLLADSAQLSVAIRSAVDNLVDLTCNVGLATIDGQLYLSGFAPLFTQPEFSRSGAVNEVAMLLDNLEPWLLKAAPNQPLSVYIGRENPIDSSSVCSLIISRFRSPYDNYSYIGVLGPTRQSYAKVMALVQQTGQALESMIEQE
jgi:heat-inducible transcriptional repressor